MRLLPAHVDPRPPRWRADGVPVAATMLGSLGSALPLVVASPALPPMGLLMLLAWRLLRSELWPAWMALPLGLFDDLVSGAPIGSSMALWTALLLVFDRIDALLVWRDHWVDWGLAAVAIQACLLGGWAIAGIAFGHGTIAAMAPQVAMTILCYPVAVRIVAVLDRWRLQR